MFWQIKNYSFEQVALFSADYNKKISYWELAERVSFISGKIESEKKQLVLLLVDNSIQSVISYLAILNSGNACMMLEKNLEEELKEELIIKYQPELIISSGSERFKNYNEFIFNDSIYIYSSVQGLGKNYAINSELALLLSTSGSTGSPKLVRLSYKNIQANAESIAKYLSINKKERPITSLPMSYSFGLSVINSHLLMGSSIVLTNQSFVLRDFWEKFNYYKCTSFAGVPYSYELLEKINFSNLELPTLKSMTQAGGRLSKDLQRKYCTLAHKNGIKFYVMYGQTEATARMSYIPFKQLNKKIGSIGIPIPGGNFKLVSGINEINANGAEGEIVYKGDNVMMGYADNRNDLVKGDENNGILYTGDFGKFDRDGYFYVIGRLKRFLKIRGSRINLDEIEKKIEDVFNVRAICIGNDEVLSVHIKSIDVTLLAKVKNYLSKLYKFHHSALHTELISSIPVSKSGKPDYKQLENKFDNSQTK